MAELGFSNIGGSLAEIMTAGDIQPGDSPSYQTCKTIYLHHPLGAKIADLPIELAQSQQREIAVNDAPDDAVKDQFIATWNAFGVDKIIFRFISISRVYGIATLVVGERGVDPMTPLDLKSLMKPGAGSKLFFNVLDPLNTAGSLITDQEPTSPDFQKITHVRVEGVNYHPSRAIVIQNEAPIYIAYTDSTFGYTGRSVYQRSLYALKSFIQTMRTDDMVARKAGVLIEKLKQPGSITDRIMAAASGIKRNMLKEAEVGNIMTIGHEDSIESLNLMNIDGAMAATRKNILENIAASTPMPAKLLNSETYAEGFGEGTEDAKDVARFVDGIRRGMAEVYAFMDSIVMRLAWNEEFIKASKGELDGLENRTYSGIFKEWEDSFTAKWPSLLTEPDSEKVKVDQTKLESIVSVLETLMPQLDPINKKVLVKWAVDNINETEMLFDHTVNLDWDAFKDYVPPEPNAPGGPGDGSDGPGGSGGGQEGQGGAPGEPSGPTPGTTAPKPPPPKKLPAKG